MSKKPVAVPAVARSEKSTPVVTMSAGTVEVTENDSISVAEFSSLFGFPAAAIIEAIRRNRTALRKAYYSIPDLAARWDCSRATVYNVLSESEFKVLDLKRDGKKRGKKLVPAAIVERIESARMESVEKAA